MKKKLQRIPFNMLWCITSFFIPMSIMNLFDVDFKIQILISSYLYFTDIANQCKIDEIEERLKELETKQ
jgi:hypothetical protein